MKGISVTEKLSLENDGKLQLFFVGAGSAFAKSLNQTNLLIIKGSDHILVDCGNTCPRALLQYGLNVTDIRNFYITHSHADHIGGLEEVLLMNRYVVRQKPNIIITEAYQTILWEMSLRGGVAHNEEDAGDILAFHDMWNIKRPVPLGGFQRETYESSQGDIYLQFMRTKHIPDNSTSWESSFWSSGVIIDNRILFTGDTRYDPDLIYEYDEKYKLEYIIHDCQFFTGGVHASLEELQQLPKEIKRKMYLVHYGDNWKNFEDKVREYGFLGLVKEGVLYELD